MKLDKGYSMLLSLTCLQNLLLCENTLHLTCTTSVSLNLAHPLSEKGHWFQLQRQLPELKNLKQKKAKTTYLRAISFSCRGRWFVMVVKSDLQG
nr:hypothetical protein CFP56_65831 [Quercus suber]